MVGRYLDKLVQPCYTLYTLIRPLVLHKLPRNAWHFDLQIDNANIEQLRQLINRLNNHLGSSRVNLYINSTRPTSYIKGRCVLLSHQGQFNDDSCVELSHAKQMAAVMCLLVWVLLYLTPQLSSMVQSHILTSNMFGSAALLRCATAAS